MPLRKTLIYPAGTTAACRFAAARLEALDVPLIDHPAPEVTHLLLDVPTRDTEEAIKLLRMLPQDTAVLGGLLTEPLIRGREYRDLLQDEDYLAQNAAITAHCALTLAAQALEVTFPEAPALILGWGRIGKCLARMLRRLDCPVTVAARKNEDLAMLRALGYDAADFSRVQELLPRTRLLINTVPQPVLSADALSRCPGVMLDLASVRGLEGPQVQWARGLPGKMAPESSGRLIAGTTLAYLKKGAWI